MQTDKLSSSTVFKPILFSTPMVQAILSGSKTQTRRRVKSDANYIQWQPIVLNGYGGFCDEHGKPVKPKYQIGDILWVRETWQHSLIPNDYCYKADTDNPIYLDQSWKWKPSLFMPKEACRIFLEIEDVKVERLQDITEEDAINEGIFDMYRGKGIIGNAYRNYLDKEGGYDSVADDAIHSFQTLWQKINGISSWDDNPFVWVNSFKSIERPSNFC